QPFVEMSYPAFRDYRGQNRVFEDLAGMPSTNQGFLLTGRGEPAALEGRWVTGNFFTVLGVGPALGRTLVPRDDDPGAARVVVLSHALWRERFSSDAGIVGQALTLNDQSFTVVGVMPAGFGYPRGAQVWTPLVPAAGEIRENAGVWWMSGLGRLRPGITLQQAGAGMTALAERYNREQHSEEGFAAVLTPVAEAVFGPTRPALLALFGAVTLVLLIACANVAGLLLVQVTERGSELAVRRALGASRASLLRGLACETLLVAAAGGATGLLLAHAGTPVLVALSPRDVPRLQDVAVDARAFGFALLASLLTAFLCALAPAGLLRRVSLEELLRGGGRGVAPGRRGLRAALVVGEVAVALVLLVGAGLLFRSFVALRQAPLGFEPRGVLSLSIALPQSRYPDAPRWRAFYEELLPRVQALPGVASAATVTLRPLWGTVGMDWPFTVEGQSAEEAGRNPLLNFEAVSPDYFATLGIAVTRGRAFTARDREGQPGVVVVSEALARRAWPGQDPLGKRLQLPLPGTPYHGAWLTVVGAVADARYREIQATRLDLYMSFLQANHRPKHLMVRTDGDPAALAPAIRAAVRGLDPDLPLAEVVTMSDVVSEALGGPRFAARVFSAFALVALLLAALGLYGLLAGSVSRRTREIGVRVALGAAPADVRRLVLGEGLALAAGGMVLGLAAALAGARLLRSLLFGVPPTDPATLAAVCLLLGAVAAAASLLPARRATMVDPAVTLRAE
ncbi:MAG TPA: ABC transporter permease, partial [Vicinamibacteria bacterium]|nr:ABC transporter permease [Vicinamibacteria bacterium]